MSLRARLSRSLADPRVAVLLVLAASLLWGSAFPAIKRGYVLLDAEPGDVREILLFAGVRFLVAGALLLGGALATRLGLRLTPKQLGCLLLLGIVQTTLQYATFYLGMAYTTAVKAAIIVASGSFFLAFFSPWLYPTDRLTGARLLGLGVGFAGVVLAATSRSTGPVVLDLRGDLLVLGTGLCSAVASLLSKRLLQDLHPVVVNGYQVTLGALILLAATLASGPVAIPAVAPELAALTLYLALVTAAAFSLYYLVVKHHDLSRVAAYRFLIPVSGVALSAALVPGERLGWRLALAALLVAAGIWTVNRRTRDEARR